MSVPTLSKANREIYRLMQDKRLSLDEVKARAAKVMDPLLPVFSPDKSTHEAIRTQIMSQLTPYLRQLLSLDVAGTWRAVKCPVIGLFGEMDKQVLPSMRRSYCVSSPRLRCRSSLSSIISSCLPLRALLWNILR